MGLSVGGGSARGRGIGCGGAGGEIERAFLIGHLQALRPASACSPSHFA
jgi:hypothetical protein